jgi:hypothetical protein
LVLPTQKKERSFDKCNQYFVRFAYRAAYEPAGSLDPQVDATDRGASITKDVPVLRIDYVSIKGQLFGVWQALYSRGVFDFKEVTPSLCRE